MTAVLLLHLTSLDFYESWVNDSKPKLHSHLIWYSANKLFGIYTPLKNQWRALYKYN